MMIKISLDPSDQGEAAEAEDAQAPTAEDETPWNSCTFSAEPTQVGRYDATGTRVATLSSGRGPSGWTITFGLDRQRIPSPTGSDHDPQSGCCQERPGRTVDTDEQNVSGPRRNVPHLLNANSLGGGKAAGPGSAADLKAQSAASLRAAPETSPEIWDVLAACLPAVMPPWRPILVLPERNVGANDTTIQMGSVSGIPDSVADELQLLRNTQAYLRARAGGRQPTTSLSRAFQRFYRLHASLRATRKPCTVEAKVIVDCLPSL